MYKEDKGQESFFSGYLYNIASTKDYIHNLAREDQKLKSSLQWDLYNNIVNQVYNRSNYFLTANAFFVLAYVESLRGHERLGLVIAFFAWLLSLVWLYIGFITRSVYLKCHDLLIEKYPSYKSMWTVKSGAGALVSPKYLSVSCLTTYIPLLILTLWTSFLIRSLLRVYLVLYFLLNYYFTIVFLTVLFLTIVWFFFIDWLPQKLENVFVSILYRAKK